MQQPPPGTILKLYDHLLRFVFFQGLSRGELLQLAGNTKFLFSKVQRGQVVTREGDACRELLLLINGTVELSTRSMDGGYTLTEQLSAPWTLQPEALFGLHPRYSSTCRTLDDCQFITLHKDEVLRLADDFFIIRLNLLNILSTQAQKSRQQQWRTAPASLAERLVRFVAARSAYPAGRKELKILMRRLAAELGCSRLEVSDMLNALQRDGLLQLRRAHILIPSMERLIQSIH